MAWLDGLAWRGDDIREIQVTFDGLLCKAKLREVSDLLVKRPSNKCLTKWYFNETKDREIAEAIDEEIVFNPQLLWQAMFTIET